MHETDLTGLASPDSSPAAMDCLASNLQSVASNATETVCELQMQHASASFSSELVTVALLLALALRCLDAHFFVILLECREVFAGLRELTLLHAFPDIPMHKSALGVHEIKLVINARENLGNGGAVRNHAASTHHLGQVTTWDHGRRLVIDAAFKPGRTPVNKLNGALRLNGGNRGVDILGHNVATVHHTAGHVLAVAWVALDKHRGRLEDRHRDLSHAQLLMVSLLCRDNGRVARQHEVDPWVWDKIGLELGNVHIERAVEAQRCREGGNDLCEEAIQVRVGRTLDIQIAAADIIKCLIVVHNCYIRVL